MRSSAVKVMRLGGAAFTQYFAELLNVTGVDTEWRPEFGGQQVADITVARNLKELACEVHPTPLAKLLPGGVLSIPALLQARPESVKRVVMGEVPFEFGNERFCPAGESVARHVAAAVPEAPRV